MATGSACPTTVLPQVLESLERANWRLQAYICYRAGGARALIPRGGASTSTGPAAAVPAYDVAIVVPPILYQLVPSVIRLMDEASVSAIDVAAVEEASLAMVPVTSVVTSVVMAMVLVTSGVMTILLWTSWVIAYRQG